MKPEEAVDLQALNTMAVASRAQYFVRATEENTVFTALDWAKRNSAPLVVLAGGSNSLLPETVRGLVLQPALRGISAHDASDRHVLVTAAAGENWHRFVQYCVRHKYYGLENLIYIPGHVGAAPIQNIGAYGVELKDVFHSLRAVHRSSGEVVQFNRQQCEFSYRDSVFKGRLKDQYLILSVTFKLSRQPQVVIHYPALKAALEGVRKSLISPEIVAHTVTTIRREKLPDPSVIPNCGSFFKNPVVDEALVARLQALYPQLVCFDAGPGKKKVAAGWLIEKSGWKGREVFDVKVHDMQALVLTNPKKMPARNVLKLAGAIKSNIRQRFEIDLEQEPQLLGWD